MNYAIILAGGAGKRFWPLSREAEPKQFLNIYSAKPMIEEVIGKVGPLIKKENLYIASGIAYGRKIMECAGKLRIPRKNILLEPQGKNTFAPIAVLSEKIKRLDSDAVIAVLPSDQYIRDKSRFLRVLREGVNLARNGYIAALGVTPDKPETGYGYIKIKSRLKGQSSRFKAYVIEKFIEKPDLSRAKKFIRDKRYYWNSGIFIFTPKTLLEEAKKLMPQAYNTVAAIKNNRDISRLWHKLPSISIDYAIMEKTGRMALLPADYGWMDLGSWEAVASIARKDKDGNAFCGRHVDISSRNTIVWSDKRLVVTLGLDNIIVVDTDDALLVCRRQMSQDIKKAVAVLKQKAFEGQI